MKRYPATEGPPGCYALHRGDAACEACPWAARCERATAANRARQTVREAADAAVRARREAVRGAEVSPEQVVRELAAEFERHGGKTWQWDTRREWLDAAALVIAACREAGWDARTYARAQGATIGWFMAERGIPMTPRAIVGPKAVARFSKWAERNQQRHGDATRDRATDPDDALLPGECLFAERYLAGDRRASEVEAEVRAVYDGWSLSVTRGKPHVRLPALVAGLIGVDRSLPHRMLAPPDPAAWRWPDARAACQALHGDERPSTAPRGELSLSPDLGMLL